MKFPCLRGKHDFKGRNKTAWLSHCSYVSVIKFQVLLEGFALRFGPSLLFCPSKVKSNCSCLVSAGLKLASLFRKSIFTGKKGKYISKNLSKAALLCQLAARTLSHDFIQSSFSQDSS